MTTSHDILHVPWNKNQSEASTKCFHDFP